MIRGSALAVALLLAVPPPYAAAHAPARVNVLAPAENAEVSAGTLRVLLTGEGGDAAASFRLELDGQAVDATGEVGGLFTSLTVLPGGRLDLRVDVAEGDHVLRVVPDPDPLADSASPVVVRRFRAVAGGRGGPWGLLGMVGVALLVAGGVAVALRRNARAADTG